MTTCLRFDCAFAVPQTAVHQRLQLCAMHGALGCLAYCEVCGHSAPEHGPGGHGCATFLQEEAELPEVLVRRLRDGDDGQASAARCPSLGPAPEHYRCGDWRGHAGPHTALIPT